MFSLFVDLLHFECQVVVRIHCNNCPIHVLLCPTYWASLGHLHTLGLLILSCVHHSGHIIVCLCLSCLGSLTSTNGYELGCWIAARCQVGEVVFSAMYYIGSTGAINNHDKLVSASSGTSTTHNYEELNACHHRLECHHIACHTHSL